MVTFSIRAVCVFRAHAAQPFRFSDLLRLRHWTAIMEEEGLLAPESYLGHANIQT